MQGPSTHQIECRAYRLWEEAGQPQGRDEEFYLEAERQLKEELISMSLKRQIHSENLRRPRQSQLNRAARRALHVRYATTTSPTAR